MLRSNSRSWRTLLIAMIAVLAFSMLAGCGKKNDEGNKTAETKKEDQTKVVATYEGGTVTAAEFDLESRIMALRSPEMEQYMKEDSIRQQLIKQLIAFKYLAGKADAKSKEEGVKQGKEQLDQEKKRLGDDQFKKILDSQKVTEDELKEYLTRNSTVFESQISKVTEDEMKKEFESKKDDYTVATVRHILINFQDPEGKERTKEDALKLAKDIKAKLDKGEDFAKLAKQYSEDPGSKEAGGLYSEKPVGTWVEAFKKAALTLPLNKISDPVETEYGYHIMRVEKRKTRTYEEISQTEKDTLKNNIASAALDKFMTGDLEKTVVKKIDLPKVSSSKSGAKNSGTTGNTGTTNEDKSGK
ncbi:peptidylprolyl isomerase [Paenibacillus sp. CAA11]|uniref:peptidylprolyl isomerase n=1 Tax=Paenibacillus sp. CAA11 TaxID=1532905 RepID=UPI000D3ABD80|nr:peptidylprolyl isomerase [Paenibacillus sp. CAA11]AWB42817.1 peptidylprolyl isomerase [Paenibacillus sp. CAA11]